MVFLLLEISHAENVILLIVYTGRHLLPVVSAILRFTKGIKVYLFCSKDVLTVLKNHVDTTTEQTYAFFF